MRKSRNKLKIKTIYTLLLLGIIFYSCGNTNKSSVNNNKIPTDTLAEKYQKVLGRSFPNGQSEFVQYYDTISEKTLKYEILYYENGNKKMEGAFSNNVRDGKWIAWYDDGVVWSVGYYINGKRSGSSNVYYPNGQTRYEKNYVNDTAQGVWMFYDETGEPIGRAEYKNGELISEESL